MSYSKFKECIYGSKGKEKQLTNLLYGAHDLCCSCDDPAAHITLLITPNSKPSSYSSEELKKIKECLGGDPAGDGVDVLDGFEDGELEKLFTEDIEDPAG